MPNVSFYFKPMQCILISKGNLCVLEAPVPARSGNLELTNLRQSSIGGPLSPRMSSQCRCTVCTTGKSSEDKNDRSKKSDEKGNEKASCFKTPVRSAHIPVSIYIHPRHGHQNITTHGSKRSHLQSDITRKNAHEKTFEENLFVKRVRVCRNTIFS